MKVTLRKTENGMTAYIAKKDLEANVIDSDFEQGFGGILKLDNGMTLQLESKESMPVFPITVNAKRVE